jgi:ubiquinone/menaquinone biosynthesis C-methylase UbiE
LASGQYLRLETKGRASGTPHQVIVRYISYNGNIIVFPLNSSEQDWVRNIESNPSVKLYFDENTALGEARPRTIAGLHDPLLSVFTRKYGSSTVDRWYRGQHRYFEIALTQELGSLRYDDLVYGDLEAAFDSIAEDYDHHIFGNQMNTWLRNLSIGMMTKIFAPGETVLEVGCGTGTETLSLARHGVKVIASDISQKMLNVLQSKADAAGLSEKITPLHSKPIDLPRKLHEMGFNSLDGAYSTYGAINTEPNLTKMVQGFHEVLKPGGRLLLGVWNKYCVYELVGYLLRANPGLAFARFRNPVPLGKSRFCVATNAFSVGSLDQFMKGYFKLERVFGAVIALPPSNLTKYLPKGWLLNSLKRLDLSIGNAFPTNRLGDHFLALYRRKT